MRRPVWKGFNDCFVDFFVQFLDISPVRFRDRAEIERINANGVRDDIGRVARYLPAQRLEDVRDTLARTVWVKA
jgi:hypothetical protein